MARVSFNKLLTNQARSSRTGEYWPSVVFVRTERSEVRTVTTSGQYSPVRPPCTVSKRLIGYIKIQPKRIDLSTRLWGINTEIVGFIRAEACCCRLNFNISKLVY